MYYIPEQKKKKKEIKHNKKFKNFNINFSKILGSKINYIKKLEGKPIS